MSFEIEVTDSSKESRILIVEPDETLAQALFRHGAFLGKPLCSGLGKCGQCRVRYSEKSPTPTPDELKRLSLEERDAGYRFSCLHNVRAGDRVEFDGRFDVALLSTLSGRSETFDPPIRLAVDLGTTSIAWRFIDRHGPGAFHSAPNPQLGAGADVMSRIAYALDPERAKTLRGVLLSFLRDVIASVGLPVEAMAISGNTAMISIFCEKSVLDLSRAPYRLTYRGGEWVEPVDGLPKTYVTPLFGPFLGGDAASGLGALLHGDNPVTPPFLLADLGTNGEFLLTQANGKVLGTSVPMGPALEGIGLSQGSMALPGAVSRFHLGPQGLVPEYVDIAGQHRHGNEPKMTGAAYLSLAAILVRLGVIGQDGRFRQAEDDELLSPIAKTLALHVGNEHGEPCFQWHDYRVTASDVEEILKVKAAFNLAFCGVTQMAGMEPGALTGLYLAGAMGQYIRVDDLVTLGFIPQQLREKTYAVGNTSLDGTLLALMNESVRDWLGRLHVDVVSLTENPSFQNLFVESMVFDYVRATLSQTSPTS